MKVDVNSPSMRIIKTLSKLKISEVALGKLERLAAKLGIDEEQLFRLYVDLKNNAYRDRFGKTPYSDRALFIPQCLRSRKCSAELYKSGFECLKCGKCDVLKIINLANDHGYKEVYVVSGGSMIKKLLSTRRPKACLGIGCFKELILGSFVCEKLGTIAQGMPLLKDGCVDTKVDWESLSTLISYKI
jgi:hypothetical protein